MIDSVNEHNLYASSHANVASDCLARTVEAKEKINNPFLIKRETKLGSEGQSGVPVICVFFDVAIIH